MARPPRVFDDVIQCVGNTPLVRIRRLTEGCDAAVLGKIESFNPLWSVKDRIAKSMLDAAEQQGLITKQTVVVEPTSGNTGIALACACAARGYRLRVTMPEGMSVERQRLLRAFGADVVLTPAGEGMNGAVRRAEEIVDQNADHFMPQQFNNPANPQCHRETTAEEIWRDTGGNVDAVVIGVGTGGTLTGVGQGLKSHNPDVQIVAVEPAGSPVIAQHRAGKPLEPGPHAIQGLGAGFIPDVLELDLIDDVVAVSDAAALETSRALAAREGLMCGISSGAAAWAALKIAARRESRGMQIVAILPDLGERYLSTRLFPE